MKLISFFLVLIASVSPSLNGIPQKQALFGSGPTEFVIVITSYKNELWAADNLHSACTQKSSRPYQVICINDCSPDKTGAIMDSYVKEHHRESMVKIIHNTERMGAIANWYNTVNNHIPDHKVVVSLDGDDLLAHDEVLLCLEKYYSDPDVWLTYGTGISYPAKDWQISRRIPDSVFKERTLRKHEFVSSHLRTFKAGLFKKIKKEDLFLEGADLAPDVAFMLPMLEMCAPAKGSTKNHSRYIPDILYLYRTDNPLNVFRTHAKQQLEAGKRIAAQKPYRPLDEERFVTSTSTLIQYIASKS